jgi:hypothetical protein
MSTRRRDDRLARFCDGCGTRLRPDNPTPLCAECHWYARNRRLLAAERERQAARRKKIVAQRIAEIGADLDAQSVAETQPTQEELTP